MKFLVMIALGVSLVFGVVDINNASKSELISLKGVGAVKADAIIKYRKAHCFKNIQDLTEVKGIGPKFITNNRENVRTGKCKKKR